MSGEEKPLNPCDLFLPKDYENDLEYRQHQPEINTDTSDDEDDGQKSRQTSPVTTISDQPTSPNPFALLQSHLKMASQTTGANSQQLGDGTSSVSVAPNTINIADVTDQFGGLTIAPQKASYLAPDDIVKKYRELEIQHQRDKLYNGKVICAILDFVKTLKDPPQNLINSSPTSRKMESRLPNCAIRKNSVSPKRKKFLSFTRNQLSIPLLQHPMTQSTKIS